LAETNADMFSSPARYSPIRGDKVDEMLDRFVKKYNVQIPLRRIAENRYLFGTKCISASIINGKLMVRVGGGYMSIEEFVQKHSV
jgi:hypothetical protein